MASYEWHARRRNYERELEEKMCGLEVADSHPLKAITVTVTKISTTETKAGDQDLHHRAQGRGAGQEGKVKVTGDFVDPLSQGGPLELAFEGIDPLSRLAAEADPLSAAPAKPSKTDTVMKGGSEANDLDETFEPWHCKRTNILAKYTTSEKLSITTSFLSSSDKEKMVIKAQATVTDKVKTRLEQLDDFEEGSVQEMLNLSQQDYVKRIEELNQALIHAWDQDQRVKALKIAIQCAKLLADVSVIPFYPSKFVLITDILDTFGNLVYDRLLEKAQYIPPGGTRPVQLPKNFTPDQVPEQAKETCRNWFFKIASIRELIPRFYVETAILHCYNFLKPGEYAEALKRLANMTRGFGDPLVAIYARCYLSRVGIKVAPGIRDHLMPCFNDFLTTFGQVQGDSVQNILALQKLEMPRYLTLYSPALDWLLQCLAHRSSEELLTQTLDKCKQHCNNALLLNSIMSAFQPQYIASRAQEFVELIRDCEETGFPKHLLYRTLGLCLVVAQTPQDQCLGVLNEVWKSVVKLKTPSDYIGCAEVWIEFVVKNFGKRELSTFLGDIIKHMTPDRAFEDFYPQLQSVVSKVVSHLHDFGVLFSLDKFLPFVNMFQRESVKVEVCKNIAEAFSKHQQEDVNDPVVINAMMFVCKTMHDTVDALTLEDEKRVIAGLIASFVRRVSFGRDFEQQLSFYVEARGSFTNLDPVLVQLIQSVNTLAMETRKVVKGNHSRKTAAFVRACAAYSFITIPSLTSQFLQLQLYLLSGQVAILNQCYSQGDAFFKAAISLLPEVPKSMEMDGKVRSTETMVVEYLLNFISTLLVVPDNPESGVLYLLRGLLNVLQEYVWDVQSDARVIIYTRVLALLSAASQDVYLHHADKVDANDAMYGSDPKFLGEVSSIASTIVDQILAHLKTLTAPENAKRQSGLALELFGTLVAHGDLTKQPVFTLALNLWNLAHKNGQADPKLSRRTLEYVKRPREGAEGQAFQTLAAKMSG